MLLLLLLLLKVVVVAAMVVIMGVHRSGDAGFGRGGGMGLVQVEVIKVNSRGGGDEGW